MNADDLRALLVKLSSGESRILTSVAPAPDQPARERYQIFHDVLAGKVLDWRRRYVAAAEQRAAEAVAQEQRLRAEKEAHAAARLRRLLALVAGLLVIVGVAAWFAWQQRQAAQRGQLVAVQARLEADAERHNAEASRLQVLQQIPETLFLKAKRSVCNLLQMRPRRGLPGRSNRPIRFNNR